MRKRLGGWENALFLAVAILALLAAVASWGLHSRLHLHNPRLQYGLDRLPAAMLSVFLFTAIAGLARVRLLARPPSLEPPVLWCLLAIGAVFCFFWLPPLIAGGFEEDDWMLLAAASIRKVILVHPWWSWYALDSVDGNFRPLGTVLYVGYMLRWFGLAPFPFLLGLFTVNLLGTLTAFFIARELGYSKLAGMAASLLYLSRGLTYTIETWIAALGDSLVILLCGLAILALLRATRRTGVAAIALHLLAWASFLLATLAKQSSFALPPIVALVFLLRPGLGRPGQIARPALARRLTTAAAGLGVYAATAAVSFLHAKTLAAGEKPPYPIAFSFEALFRTFSHAIWYVLPLELPNRVQNGKTIVAATGLAAVLGLAVLVRAVPRLLGERPRDVVFCLLAAAASVSLFVVLASRVGPYYGSMAAFWTSIAVAIALTRCSGEPAARAASAVFCLLLITGLADVRLKQTGLLPSGYTWGTYGSDTERRQFTAMRTLLRQAPATRTLVLADVPGVVDYYPSMALLIAPELRRILLYDSRTGQFTANDRNGERPGDGRAALSDAHAYTWSVPVSPPASLAAPGTLWLSFHGDEIGPGN